MATFIGLTDPQDERVMVNADHIVTMSANDEQTTFIALTNGGVLYVMETIYDIVEMLEPESEV